MRLADGSEVDLNTDTAICPPETSGRHIELYKGEAHFKVAHDSRHPLTVKAGDVLVRAVGTEFTVRVLGVHRVSVLR
jgi:transmembrane sensor